MMLDVEQVMRLAPVIPVLVVDRLEDAIPIALALVAGGLPAIEVTLRTPVALDVIRLMAQVDGAVVGAGTVLDARSLDAAMAAGASFIVSPGLTEPLARAAGEAKVPLLPGVATATDVMRGLDLGLSRFKFFPAAAAGGIPALTALTGPFPQVRFCPTGGVSQDNAAAWLGLEAVLCVGGSWIAPRGAPDPATIEAAARQASNLGLKSSTTGAGA